MLPRLVIVPLIALTLYVAVTTACADDIVIRNGQISLEPLQEPPSKTVVVHPDGTTFDWEEEALSLDFPIGSVEEPTEVTVTLIPSSRLNKSAYIRNTVSLHFAKREIGEITYPGDNTVQPLFGIHIGPQPLPLIKPVSLSYRSIGIIPAAPRVATISEFGGLRFLDGEITARKADPVEALSPAFPTYVAGFSLPHPGAYMLADTRQVDAPELAELECKDEDPCRCLRYRVESGEFDYTTGSCQVLQRSMRIQYLDCPGQPVFEDIQKELSEQCRDVEPIPDLLDYAPGKKWRFSFDRTRALPERDGTTHWWCGGRQRVTHSLTGEFVILPEETPDGRQMLDAAATADVSATLDTCTDEYYQAEASQMPATRVPIQFAGATLLWNASRRPALGLTFIFQSHQATPPADHIFSRQRAWDFDENRWDKWEELRVPLEYERMFGIVQSETQSFEISREYLGGEWPWSLDFILMHLPGVGDREPRREFKDTITITSPDPF